ncbi:MAG TPA: M23 family metallopeptidase [Candidatus Limnocylindrales bacterium]|nr:M23 family metallopeptidase [Candidatus Limnocylindrales bacterium]
MQASWLEHQVSFRRADACACWYAIAGIGLDVKPGVYTLKLEGNTGAGEKLDFSRTLQIGAAKYPTTTITVAPQFVEPPKEVLARIEEEQAFKKAVFAKTEPAAEWNGGFDPPTDTTTSGGFGSSRLYNGHKQSQHTGLDFHAAVGTPVHATNSGKVIVARPLYYEGNCVMIDHGQGLISIYMHLSEFKVKEGDEVKKGQLIALSGGTGRSTGPHLHFAVRWQGLYLNPATLLALKPPSR